MTVAGLTDIVTWYQVLGHEQWTLTAGSKNMRTPERWVNDGYPKPTFP
jgi:hypothetical protein